MGTQYDIFGEVEKRAIQEARPTKPNGRFQYKLAIYSPDRVAETLALVRYLGLPITMEKPLIKNAFDSLTQRSATFMYFHNHPQPYITLLEDEGRNGHNLDAYLVYFDWETRRNTKLQEVHYHKSPRRDTGMWEEIRNEEQN